MSVSLSAKVCQEIDTWVAKFPKAQKRSAVIMALRLAQDAHGLVDEPVIQAVADYLGLPVVQVAEVATFYTMYRKQPTGTYRLAVCNSVSCMLCGSKQLLAYLKQTLKVELDEVSQDGVFSIHETECLAACAHAPALVINDIDYYYKMTPEKVDVLLAKLREEVIDGTS